MKLFKPGIDRIHYGGAMIGQEEKDAINAVIDANNGTRWTVGPESSAFETELADVTGVKHAVLVNSGSSALLVAVAALKLPQGSKIIIPACNFPTAFNAIIQNGHIPVVVDCELSTFNLSLDEVILALTIHPDIKAVIAVDIAGNPVDLIHLRHIVGNRKIILDNCIAEGTLIKTDHGDIPIEEINIGDSVLTRKGYRQVTNVWDKGFQEVITKLGVTATPDHKFITTNGKKELNVLQPSDILYVWNQKSLSIEEKTIEDIQRQSKDTEESITITEKNFYIGRFGKTIMGKFLKDISYITETMIHLITNYQIYSVLQQDNTLAYTSQRMGDSILQKGTSLKQEMEQYYGINRKKERYSTPGIINGFGQLGKRLKNFAQFVRKNISLSGLQNQSTALKNVKHVYDLTVEKDHEFFANNILVSNCDGYGTTLNSLFIDTYADISCVSFHAAHIITMGEGGAVLTNDPDIASCAMKLREWGRASGTDKIYTYPGFPNDYKERYVYEEIGWNLKPLELQCAMGRVQLKKLSTFKAQRAFNFNHLHRLFIHLLDTFTQVSYLTDSYPCWFSFPLLVKENRGKIMEIFENNNIECRTVFAGNITRHPAYKDTDYIRIGDLKNSDIIMARGMFLSVHPSLTQDMIHFIGEVAKLC